MTDRVSRVIQEIAEKHGVAIGRDDPIMVLHTMNEALLVDSAAAHEAALDRFRSELEIVSQRWTTESETLANRVLNASLDTARTTIRTDTRTQINDASEQLAEACAAALAPLAEVADQNRRTAWLNVAAAAILSLGGVVYALLTMQVI